MSDLTALSKQKALSTLRIIWASLLMGPIMFFVILMFIVKPTASGSTSLSQTLHMVSLVVTLVFIPAGYMIRLQTYKKHWQVNSVTPQGYLTGNLILLAICEGAALLGVIVTFLEGTVMPYIIPAFIAVMTHIINWPNGKAMEPAELELRQR